MGREVGVLGAVIPLEPQENENELLGVVKGRKKEVEKRGRRQQVGWKEERERKQENDERDGVMWMMMTGEYPHLLPSSLPYYMRIVLISPL